MIESLPLRLGRVGRGTIPTLLTGLLVLLGVVPWPIPGVGPVMPAFALIAVYFWTLYRPRYLPYAATFGLGLLADSLSGQPVGLGATVLLLVQGLVASQRRILAGKTFPVVWWGFALIAPGAVLLTWALASIYFGTALGFTPFAVQAVLTVLAYPPVALLLGRAHQHLMAGL